MELYAKSIEKRLTQDTKAKLLRQLEESMEIFTSAEDAEICKLLQKYKESLQQESFRTEQKTLRKHLEETVRCAENFFQIYGDYFEEKHKQLILDACRMHDIGKANYIFQTIVNSDLKKEKQKQIPHGFLSAMVLSKKEYLKQHPLCGPDDFSVLLTAVYYHHTRSDLFDAKAVQDYCRRFYLDAVREYFGDPDIALYLGNRNQLLFSEQTGREYIAIEEELWCEYMLVKGMLNKFDWTVSAGYADAEKTSDRNEKKLCGRIQTAIKQMRPAQQFMMQNTQRSVIMTAPTGSGKTEAALLWLNGEKGFYTLPLKVSSNAIYQRIREKYEYEDVALLHADSMNSYLKAAQELEDGYRNFEQAKLFSYPLTVCTVDQLFRFVYKALGTEIFAATLKYSKVVIDEMQSYSPRVVAALIFGLSEIKRMGGKFAIITATFPPVFEYFMKKSGLLEGTDYISGDFSGSASESRHRIRMAEGDFEWDFIKKEAGEKKILIICNTVSKAQQVYENLKKEGMEPGLLHSRFIRQHRTVLENRILSFSSDEGRAGIWVTTQIVEASLDIDFDILYTEMCTADSLLQRMGRCNRAGKKKTDEPNIIIYQNQSGRGTIYDATLYDRSVELLKHKDGELLSETDKIEYIKAVYDVNQIRKTSYFQQIEENLKHLKTLTAAEYDMKTAQKKFRGIQSICVMPDCVYEDNVRLIESIRSLLQMPHVQTGIRKLLKDKLAGMTLSLTVQYGIPDGIDKDTIAAFDIHRTGLRYEFDGVTGQGLILEKVQDEGLFL